LSRPLLTLLCAATLAPLSCAFVAPAALAPAEAALATTALPSVDAGPPGSELSPPLGADTNVASVASYLASRRTGLSRAETDTLARAIFVEAARHELDPQLVLAVMHVESRFNAFALSPVGAMGLMQVMPATGEELASELGVPWHGVQTLFDPLVNLRLGVAYLKQLQSRYGDTATALAAYNWGPGHIDRRLRRGRALPTEYPRLVLDAHADGAGRTAS
jgi:soluble lytic murein transglycosylase-like protein